MSGGRSTIMLAKGEKASAQAGDISIVDAAGQAFLEKFTVEAKHVKSLDVHHLIWGAQGGIVKYWAQAVNDATAYDKLPLLVAKQNHKATLLCATQSGALRLFGAHRAGTLLVAHIKRTAPAMRVYLWEDFLQWAYPIK